MTDQERRETPSSFPVVSKDSIDKVIGMLNQQGWEVFIGDTKRMIARKDPRLIEFITSSIQVMPSLGRYVVTGAVLVWRFLDQEESDLPAVESTTLVRFGRPFIEAARGKAGLAEEVASLLDPGEYRQENPELIDFIENVRTESRDGDIMTRTAAMIIYELKKREWFSHHWEQKS